MIVCPVTASVVYVRWLQKSPRILTRCGLIEVFKAHDIGYFFYNGGGDSADFAKRVSAFVFAQAYLKRFQRPAVLPLTRFAEGEESDKFLQLFLKPVGYRIDANPEPERLHPLMRTAPKAAPHCFSSPVLLSPTRTTAPCSLLVTL